MPVIVSEPDEKVQTAEAEPAAQVIPSPKIAGGSPRVAEDSLEHIPELSQQPAEDMTAESHHGDDPPPEAAKTPSAGIYANGNDLTNTQALFPDFEEPQVATHELPNVADLERNMRESTTGENSPEASNQPATEIEADPLSDDQRTQQHNEVTAAEISSPEKQRRGRLTRIAVDAEGRRLRLPTPPPRPETPLIDLEDEGPTGATSPAFVYAPNHAGGPAILGFDPGEKVDGEGEASQILVTFDPLLMCPCNLEGHPCMLPLRCRYRPGVICTKWVSPPFPAFPLSCRHRLTYPRTAAAHGSIISQRPAARSVITAPVSGVASTNATSAMTRQGLKGGPSRHEYMPLIILGMTIDMWSLMSSVWIKDMDSFPIMCGNGKFRNGYRRA